MSQIQSAKCIECGAPLSVGENGKPVSFCPYCGTRTLADNYKETVHRRINEAEVIRAETERAVKMKEMELLEQRLAETKRKVSRWKKIFGVAVISAVLVGLLLLFSMSHDFNVAGIWLIVVEVLLIVLATKSKQRLEQILNPDLVKIPTIAFNATGESYIVVEEALRAVGFTNVRSVPLADLTFGGRKKNGTVSEITVNGEPSFRKKYIPGSSSIVISYHSLRS